MESERKQVSWAIYLSWMAVYAVVTGGVVALIFWGVGRLEDDAAIVQIGAMSGAGAFVLTAATFRPNRYRRFVADDDGRSDE